METKKNPPLGGGFKWPADRLNEQGHAVDQARDQDGKNAESSSVFCDVGGACVCVIHGFAPEHKVFQR